MVRYRVLGNVQELAEFRITCIRNEINISGHKVCNRLTVQDISTVLYRGADKSLARQGRKQATATKL